MDMNHPSIGRYDFCVEPFSEDYAGRLSWGTLGNHLLRCSSLHAGTHGFGYDQMQAVRHAWVLSRLVIEMERMPRTGEKYGIRTWVNRVYRQFTDRQYAIVGEGGAVCGYGSSVWALIDVASRQPADLESLPGGGFAAALLPDTAVPVKGAGRIRLREAAPAFTRTARYTDLDINGHVNSIRYIEMVLDLFPTSVLDAQDVRRVEMAYCSESHCGDVLTLFHEEQAPGTHAVEIRKADGETAVKALVRLAPR